MADPDPWAEFNPRSAPQTSAPANDPWAEFSPRPAPKEQLGMVGQALKPITSYPETHKEVVRESLQTMGHGLQELAKPTGGDLWESTKAAAKGVAGVGGGAIQYAISPITAGIRTTLSRPVEEITGLPKEYTEFGTELAIPGIGLTRAPRIPMIRRAPAKGPEAEAGRLLEHQIGKEGGDPEAVRRALESPPEEIVPGSKPTTFQATGDLGAGQVERGATTRHPAAFQERFGEQNAARLEAIEKLQAEGSPGEVATHLRDALRAETTQAEEGVRLAQQRAWEASQQIGGTYDPTTYGNIFRRELQDAEATTRAYERSLWDAVDPGGTLGANPQGIQQLERRIYGVMPEGGAAEASLAPIERRITDIIQNYPPQGIPFSELRSLRSLVSTELRKELYTNGQTPTYARLSQLRGGIEEAIVDSVGEQAAQRVRAASAATAQRAQTFRAPGVKEATRREGVQGPYKVGEASVPEQFIKTGPEGYDRASNYLRAVGDPGLPEFTDAVAAKARRVVIGPDGAIDPGKLQTFLRQHAEVLRAIDQRDGGAFSQRLRNLGTAQETLDTALARQTGLAKQQGKDALANIIGATEDADITRMIVGIFGKHDSVQRMGELVRRLGGNDAALQGARRAVVEHLRTRLLSNMEAAATGRPIIRAEQFQNFVKHNEPALRQIMSPEQVQSMLDIARDIQRRSNRTVQTGIRGRPTSTQDVEVLRRQQESALKAGAKQVGKVAGKGLIDTIASFIPGGPFAVRAGESVLSSQMAKWKAKGINSIQELVDEAMLNPEVARELLSKTHTTQIKPGIRAPFQTGGGVPAIGGVGGRPDATTTSFGSGPARQRPDQAVSYGRAQGHWQTYQEGGAVPSYDTELSPGEEVAFKGWKEKYAPQDSGEDYDLRGAFKAKVRPDPYTGHWPDTFKKPNHPTFSDQSQYAKDRPDLAGSWEGETYIPPLARAEGGEVQQPERLQSRERLGAAFSTPFGSGSPAGGGEMTGGAFKTKAKAPPPLWREDIVRQLKTAGMPEEALKGWTEGWPHTADSRARGGDVDPTETDEPNYGDRSPFPNRRDPGEEPPGPISRPMLPGEQIVDPLGHRGERGPSGYYLLRGMAEGGDVEEKKEPSLPPAVAENWGDPFERAAARTARGVRPEGGRREGLATALISSVVPGVLSFPERFTKGAMGAAEGDPERMTGREQFELLQYMTGMGPRAGPAGSVLMAGRRGGRAPPVPPKLEAGEVPAADRPVTRGHNLPPEALPSEPLVPILEPQPKTTGVGRMRALRELPYDEAMARARTEQHLVPREGGGYEGAPDWVKTPEDLARLRAHLDEQARKGLAGRTWYERGQEGVKEMAGPEPHLQRLAAREHALFSPKATPETNLGFQIQAHNAYEAGKPLDVAYTGQQARTYKKGREEGEIQLGKKTGPYASHLNPQEETPAIPVNDIHHLRNFQYEDPEGGASAATHAFMDAETLLAADRANTIKLGGHEDWTPGRIQAAAWVEAKAQKLMQDHGWTYEKAMADAINAYIEHFPKYTAYGTHEATPGVGTRHLPGIAQGTEAERGAFAADPRSFWRDPSGRDIMYRSLGMWTRPTIKSTGVYEGPAGLEINPAEVGRPMVSFAGPTGDRSVAATDRAMLNAAEAARAYVDVQNAGAWSMPIYKQKTGVSTSLHALRPGVGPLPITDISKLQAIGGRHGLPGVIDYGEGAALTSFGGGPTGRELGKNTALPQEVESVLGVKPIQTKLDTGYIDYSSLWGKKEGTGAVTRELKKYLTNKDAPAIIAKLDSNTELRQSVLAKMERDAEIAAQISQPIRADVQLARKIISEEGFAGLFRALKRGAALPAVAFAPLVQLFQQGEEVNRGE